MTSNLKFALLIGVVTFVAGAGMGLAQMEGPQPPDGPMQGLTRSHDRLADRLVHEFDNNHDGKVSHDEMNRAIGARFSAATRRAPAMSLDQFVALHQDEFRRHAAETFRRLDWDGNAALSVAEYAAPQRVRFLTMDEAGTGSVSCAPPQQTDNRARSGSNYGGRGGFGLSGFCMDNDTNRDGKVTRAELDASAGKRFSAATGGASAMNGGQYLASLQQWFRSSNARTFHRLDRDGDGKLTVQEFAGNELRLFVRLDRNKDGVLSSDEMRPRVASNRGDRRSYD
jgi:Ca2+-binding EF-hand superfamily protein